MIARLALTLAAVLSAVLAGPVPAEQTDPFAHITPVTTVIHGSTLTISAFDSTGFFPSGHVATAAARIPEPSDTWPKNSNNIVMKCDEYYTVEEGDTCNQIIGTKYLYWNIDWQHLLLWNPHIGLECEHLKVGLKLCLYNNQQALATETAAFGY